MMPVFFRHMSYFDEEFESDALPVITTTATATATLKMEKSSA